MNFFNGKHRKTVIREEGWPLIDGWYWCPESLIDKRMLAVADEVDEYRHKIGVGYEFRDWVVKQHKLTMRLAHLCEDGSIRAPEWVQAYPRSCGGISIYGRCKGCREPISQGVKTIILLENM